MSAKYGIGEVYRVEAEEQLVRGLRERYGFDRIYEYPVEPMSGDFPISWMQTDNPEVEGDLLFTFRAFPHVVRDMKRSRCRFLMLVATNLMNAGVFVQHLLWKTKEFYSTLGQLRVWAQRNMIFPVEVGYYDLPLWPDIAISSGNWIHFNVNDQYVKRLTVLENLPLLRSLRGHHVYCLGWPIR